MVRKHYAQELTIFKTVFLFCFAIFLACMTDLTYGQGFDSEKTEDFRFTLVDFVWCKPDCQLSIFNFHPYPE